jgi:hypothetical protein
MSSRHETARVSGRLQGMGHNVRCTVHAVKVWHPSADVYEYVRPVVTGVPEDLPDGLYKLTFDAREVSVQRLNGAWVSPVAV